MALTVLKYGPRVRVRVRVRVIIAVTTHPVVSMVTTQGQRGGCVQW